MITVDIRINPGEPGEPGEPGWMNLVGKWAGDAREFTIGVRESDPIGRCVQKLFGYHAQCLAKDKASGWERFGHA